MSPVSLKEDLYRHTCASHQVHSLPLSPTCILFGCPVKTQRAPLNISPLPGPAGCSMFSVVSRGHCSDYKKEEPACSSVWFFLSADSWGQVASPASDSCNAWRPPAARGQQLPRPPPWGSFTTAECLGGRLRANTFLRHLKR